MSNGRLAVPPKPSYEVLEEEVVHLRQIVGWREAQVNHLEQTVRWMRLEIDELRNKVKT